MYYKFFDKYRDVTKFQKVEMYADLLHLAFFEHNLFDCVRTVMQSLGIIARWNLYGSIFSRLDNISFNCTCCAKHKKHDRRELGLFIEETILLL